MRLLAVALILALACAAAGEVIFCNLAPGLYQGTCDGEMFYAEVGADGTLSAECQSVSIRMTGGVSFRCEAVDE